MISPVPPLAGLCSIDEATRPGLTVDECVRRLKRLHYAFRRLHGIFNARITAEPLYELKSAFSYHAYLCAEHVDRAEAARGRDARASARARGSTGSRAATVLRRDPRGPGDERARGRIYGRALPAIAAALDRYVADTHPSPTRRAGECAGSPGSRWRHARFRRARASPRCRPAMTTPACQQHGARRSIACLAAAGGLDGCADADRRPRRRAGTRRRPTSTTGYRAATSGSPIRTTWP